MFKQRIESGARFLTEELGPDWPERIDRERLVMSAGCSCIVGQLYGEYNKGLTNILGSVIETKERRAWALEHGFEVHDDWGHCSPGSDRRWETLTAEWLEVLTPMVEKLHADRAREKECELVAS